MSKSVLIAAIALPCCSIIGLHRREPLPHAHTAVAIDSYSSPPIAPIAPVYITPELRQPSMHQLEKMRSIRQNLQHQSGLHIAPPPPSNNVASTLDYPAFKPSMAEPAFHPPAKVIAPIETSSQLKSVPSGDSNTLTGVSTAETYEPSKSQAPEKSVRADNPATTMQTIIYDSSSDSDNEINDDCDEDEQEEDEESVSCLPEPEGSQAASAAPAASSSASPGATATAAPASNSKVLDAPAVPEKLETSKAAAAEAAAAALYAKKLEQLLAERDQEILALRTSQLKALEAQLLLQNPQQFVPAPVVAPSGTGVTPASASAPGPVVSAPPVDPSGAPAPQQQHIHIHNHFPSSNMAESTQVKAPESKLSGSISGNATTAVSTEASKENADRGNSNGTSAGGEREAYLYPYERPYYAPRPQPQAQQPSSTGGTAALRVDEVEVIYKPVAVSTGASAKSSTGSNSGSYNKGSTLVERALDLSGLTLERLRELTGRY